MGDLAENNQDALPLHGVRIESFYISRYETTLEQYDLFAQKTGATLCCRIRSVAADTLLATCPGKISVLRVHGGAPAHRAGVGVCGSRRSGQTNLSGRMTDEVDDFVRHRVNSMAESFPVGRKKPNLFGLYDMGGNVAEWIGDFWSSTPSPGRILNGSISISRSCAWRGAAATPPRCTYPRPTGEPVRSAR